MGECFHISSITLNNRGTLRQSYSTKKTKTMKFRLMEVVQWNAVYNYRKTWNTHKFKQKN